MEHLVILGAGTAGTVVANRLRAAIPPCQLRITVIDQNDEHHYQPGYVYRAFGKYSRRDIVRARHCLLADGIELVLTAIDKVHPKNKQIQLAGGRRVGYDTLVIATGVTPRPDRVEGMMGPQFGKSVHQFYTLKGADRLRKALREFAGGRLVIHICEFPIKCPVAPIEFALLADAWLRRRGLRGKAELVFVTPFDGVFTRPETSRQLGGLMVSQGISVETDFVIECVDNEARQIVGYDGRRIGFDLLVTVPPNMGADYIQRSGIGDELNLVPCDPHTMEALDLADTYVLGDAGTLPTSKSGAVTHFSAETFVDNFLAKWRARVLSVDGSWAEERFEGHLICFIDTGDRRAIMLDFDYETPPLPGAFPFPVIGPVPLMRPSYVSRLLKLGLAWYYWHVVLRTGRVPFPIGMIKARRYLEGLRSGSGV